MPIIGRVREREKERETERKERGNESTKHVKGYLEPRERELGHVHVCERDGEKENRMIRRWELPKGAETNVCACTCLRRERERE